MRIAQAEGKKWKKEVRSYLIAYRLTHHTTTGVSAAELLFGRKIRTKLPEFREDRVASEVRVRTYLSSLKFHDLFTFSKTLGLPVTFKNF